MLAARNLTADAEAWNATWGAPYGKHTRVLRGPLARLAGAAAFQRRVAVERAGRNHTPLRRTVQGDLVREAAGEARLGDRGADQEIRVVVVGSSRLAGSGPWRRR